MKLPKPISTVTFSILLLCTVALTSCQQGTSTPGTQDETPQGENGIHIGILAPKTGIMSGHGNSIEMGAQLAAEHINAQGGVNGQEIVLHVVDTKSDPSTTTERTKELIDRFEVSLLIGTGFSSSSLAAIAPATEKMVPFIYSLDGEAKTCMSGNKNAVSQYVWGAGFTERMIVEPYLRYLGEQFAKPGEDFTVYFIGGDYVYPRSTNAYAIEVANELGYKVIGEEYSDTSTQDYTPVIRRILNADPDLLIVTNPGASGVTFMRQAQQLGLPEAVLISGFATFDQEAIDAMGNASEGVYVVNRYSNQIDNPENEAFVAAFREKYPDKPLLPGPTVAGGGYGSLLIAAEAFRKAGSTDPVAFYEAMRGLEIDLPQGRVRVNPDNNIFDHPIYIMQIKNQEYEVVADLGIQVHPEFEGCSVE